ncbi:uroporphyrinogen decarboxylase family protein [Bacillus sp. FJAT-50079]|uniref:uroporphyrinogen decarboxylase family protein n=1 Tax=Bacillus sp. FJAT-50079 TaxID=2833577 RepID=UPI001BC9826A|nr:uroporphyrinogen decarboxylase family protein [Bacillus sp. FJAT-50079]MBS4206688.1 hypothetical protein [Bacillus sp. FJAT-50079]
MGKFESVLNAVRGEKLDYVPAGFWLHFPSTQHHGKEAVEAHINFFRKTNTDIMKIMNENLVPYSTPITKADDWRNIRPISLKDPFVVDQLDIIKRIVDRVGDEAVILTTIHGTIASAFHARGGGENYDTLRTILSAHLREKPEVVANAFRILSEGMAEFTQSCLEAGAQGIYYSALGGEKELFTDEEFEQYIKPNDLLILNAAKSASAFNVLHICKDNVNFERYKDYDPEVVNWAVHENRLTLKEGRKLFPNSTILGGLDDRSGVLVSGTEEEIEKAVFSILDEVGTKKFILGADCTLPTEMSYEKIRMAVESTKKYYQK